MPDTWAHLDTTLERIQGGDVLIALGMALERRRGRRHPVAGGGSVKRRSRHVLCQIGTLLEGEASLSLQRDIMKRGIVILLNMVATGLIIRAGQIHWQVWKAAE